MTLAHDLLAPESQEIPVHEVSSLTSSGVASLGQLGNCPMTFWKRYQLPNAKNLDICVFEDLSDVI